MEEYEDFYKREFSKIQGEEGKGEDVPPGCEKGLSFIQFHGVAVLSPLLNLDRKREMQQYKQKAVNIELSRENVRKSALLSRVQEILQSVQIKTVPNIGGLDVSEATLNSQTSKLNAKNGFAILPNLNSLPALTAHCGSTKVETAAGNVPPISHHEVTTAGKGFSKAAEDTVSPKRNENLIADHRDNAVDAKPASSNAPRVLLSSLASVSKVEETKAGVSPPALEVPDHYAMSLQNLLRKSREYVEREQSKHSAWNNSGGGASESHSDKENDLAKACGSIRERAKFLSRSRSSSPVAIEKLNSIRPSVQSLDTSSSVSSMNASPLSSSCKADVPIGSAMPLALNSDSDEELQFSSHFENENSVFRSLTGSYIKLPSPEPSQSPKMHRRRSRPLSAGNIVINYPVNAFELSPKGKSSGLDLVVQNGSGNLASQKISSDGSVASCSTNGAAVCTSRPQVTRANTSETYDVSLHHPNSTCINAFSRPENTFVGGMAALEREVQFVRRGSLVENVYFLTGQSNESLTAQQQSPVSHGATTVTGNKATGVLYRAKRGSPVELNKSYDVETPSPVLLQSQSMRQVKGISDASLASEKSIQNNADDQVKRNIDLDLDGTRKSCTVHVVVSSLKVEEKPPVEQVINKTCGGISKFKILCVLSCSDEECLRKQMVAFEEMRKKLEEQHAQQLSLLIAEQEREQEKLHKEIEQQERRFREKRIEVPELHEKHTGDETPLDWREMNDSDPQVSIAMPVDLRLNTISHSTGFGSGPKQPNLSLNVTAANSPFFLWDPEPSGMPKVTAPRSVGRSRNRWSQIKIHSPEMQKKFDRITALAKGFLIRRLMQTEKVKHLRQTVKDTLEFIKTFQTEVPIKRGAVSTQDASLQERVYAQLRAALYEIYDIFLVMVPSERMSILNHDREVRKEKLLRQMEKVKSPRDRVSLSAATQKSLDRKKQMKAAELRLTTKKVQIKHKSETRILQPNQGQNAPIQRGLCRQGTPKASVRGGEQSREKPSENRAQSKALSGVYARRPLRTKPNLVAI
uniref:Centriolar coiled-coil protein 110 n=1 Tax=Latimeria chalumnae TaxID=7897 RepID=H3AZQ7_LATCH